MRVTVLQSLWHPPRLVLARIRTRLRQVRWWPAPLPHLPVPRLPRLRPMLVLRIGHGSLGAEVTRRGRTLWAGTARYETPEELVEALAQLAAEATLPGRPRVACAVLEPPLVQVRTLRGLPPVRPGALRALVALQAGRFFRRNGTPLVTDAAWLRRGRGLGRERVARAAAVEEPWVEAIAAGARAAGLELETIRVAAEPAAPALDLLSPAEHARRHRVARLALRRLALAAAALWCVAGAIVVIRVRRERQRVARELAVVDAPVKAVGAARRRLGEVARVVETMQAAERERAVVLALVGRVVAALPDSAYLTSLELDAASAGRLTGAAKQAAEVVAALERAGVTRKAELAGPAVREVLAGREWERFTVRFESHTESHTASRAGPRPSARRTP